MLAYFLILVALVLVNGLFAMAELSLFSSRSTRLKQLARDFSFKDVDGLLVGYSTTFNHLMLSTVFAEHYGLEPAYAHAVLVGGATGFAMAFSFVS